MTDTSAATPPTAPGSGPAPADAPSGPPTPPVPVSPAVAAPPGWGPRPGLLPYVPPAPSLFARSVTRFWRADREAPATWALVTCGVAGLAGAGLLVGHRLGLGAALVGLLVWAAAAPRLVRRRAVGDFVTMALSIALVGVVAVRDAGWVVGLCLAVAAFAATVAATSARSALAVVAAPVSWAAGAMRAVPWASRGVGSLVGKRRGQVRAAVRSVAVTVGLLLVFGLLFTSADRVFASYVPRVDLGRLPGQVIVGVLVAIVAATLADLVRTPPGWSVLALPAGRPARRGEWLLPVLALDVMVLAFVLVQLGALVGGSSYVHETAGLTYAEYARQGFGQLVAVTALTLVVVAVAARRAPRASSADRILTRVALGVLCVGTSGVVASALRRMDLYVGAFGLTRLRLFVTVVEVVMGLVLVLLLVAGVRWRGGWLPRAVVQVVAVAMLGLALVNPDAQIVRVNTGAGLAREVDVSYLQGLSADAVPTIDALDEPLRSCLLERMGVATSDGVAGWNLGRYLAWRATGADALDDSADDLSCAMTVSSRG